MKKLLLLISLISIFSCANQSAINAKAQAKAQAKARHQAETGSRLNNASQDTDRLFEEMK